MTSWQRFLIGILTIFLGVGGWVVTPSSAAGNHPLEGRVFVVDTGRSGEGPSGRDVYCFREGKFLSTFHNTQHDFPPGPYTGHRVGDVIHFAADAQSPTRGSIHWEGTIRGEIINAAFFWRDTPRWYSWHNGPAKYWARSAGWGPTTSSGPDIAASHLLDGQVYFVKTGEKGNPPDHSDYLIFWEGRFVSSACVELNFSPSAYSAIEKDGTIRFHAEIRSPNRGRMTWRGTVRRNNTEGTAEWHYKRLFWEVVRHYWFRGPVYSME